MFDIGGGKAVEVLTPATILQPPDATKVTVIKLHGSIDTPAWGCDREGVRFGPSALLGHRFTVGRATDFAGLLANGRL